jgi:transcriptional regulator with XRE-family HTH domain
MLRRESPPRHRDATLVRALPSCFGSLVGPGRVRCGLLCTSKICSFPTRGAFPNRSGKLSKVKEMDSFGVVFGRLVREKRGIEGLSQDGLAEKSGLPKARISDIETGKIANPQARTVDALCVALNISREERAALILVHHQQFSSKIDALRALFRLVYPSEDDAQYQPVKDVLDRVK